MLRYGGKYKALYKSYAESALNGALPGAGLLVRPTRRLPERLEPLWRQVEKWQSSPGLDRVEAKFGTTLSDLAALGERFVCGGIKDCVLRVGRTKDGLGILLANSVRRFRIGLKGSGLNRVAEANAELIAPTLGKTIRRVVKANSRSRKSAYWNSSEMKDLNVPSVNGRGGRDQRAEQYQTTCWRCSGALRV